MAASRSMSCTTGYFEKRSIQYSKSSKASLSFSPWTSWTMRPPMRSIEGISIRSFLAFPGSVPPPLWGYLGRKILVFNGLQRGGGCKILVTNGLCAKYLLSMRYGLDRVLLLFRAFHFSYL